MPEHNDYWSNRRIAELERENTALREALYAVVGTDKTVYDYRGKAAQNRDGRVPDEGRWSTPREIARAALGVAMPGAEACS